MASLITHVGHLHEAKTFYNYLKDQATNGQLFIAHGSELETNPQASVVHLGDEKIRVAVDPKDVVYIEEVGSKSSKDVVSDTPTNCIRVFGIINTPGDYAEWGLFSEASQALNSGKLLVYQYAESSNSRVIVGACTEYGKYIYIIL